MRQILLRAACAALLPFTALPLVAVAAHGQEPVATTTTLTGTTGYAGRPTTLEVTLTEETGAPVAGQTVTLQRRRDGDWSTIGELVTDGEGTAETTAQRARQADDNVFRARYAGGPGAEPETSWGPSSSGAVQVRLERRRSRVGLTAPDRVVDEKSIAVVVSWRTRGSDEPVSGRVRLQRRVDGRWRTMRSAVTDGRGRARFTLTPRADVMLRARARQLDWVRGDESAAHRVDNVPPAPPVQLPAAAPRPRINLPDQARATGEGANVVVTRIPDGVWNQMTGVTWHRGCPVGRPGLRLLRVNYYDYSGYRRRGELVVAAGAAGRFAGALRDIHAAQLPLRSMYRVDRFGWSDRLRGGNDYKSMAAGNTSAFNCRSVVGRPGVRSPHSWGRAFDLNTWENPYHSADGWVPNRWWATRSHARVAWRSREHAMVRILLDNGFSWTYGTSDSQHFDARTSSGRVLRLARCSDVCH
jgi:5-hydroxyisourate hydrolase-like protein (transthyretin family)